jgi:hypothetical protein
MWLQNNIARNTFALSSLFGKIILKFGEAKQKLKELIYMSEAETTTYSTYYNLIDMFKIVSGTRIGSKSNSIEISCDEFMQLIVYSKLPTYIEEDEEQ